MAPGFPDVVWVVEAFDATERCTRWVLPELSDEAVGRCLGVVPEGLADVNADLLIYLRREHGLIIDRPRFSQVVIGREQC